MVKSLQILILGTAFLSASCTVKKLPSRASTTNNLLVDGKLWASFWHQRSAEYRALCFQAYNLAHVRLDQALLKNYNKPLAIITDIDETVLDNSPNTVNQGLIGKDYEKDSWYAWTAKAKADTVPGVASFLKYAASKSVKVFYITNRDERERDVTLKNLQKFDLPDTDYAHLILKTSSSSKEQRRLEVMKNYEVLLLIGDNLADFSSLFDKQTEENRTKAVNQAVSQFGSRFIVIPNVMYGDWEGAFFQYNYQLDLKQKEDMVKKGLKSE